MRTRRFIVLALVLGGVAVEGCSPVPPYVYKHAEFDRRNPKFNREPTEPGNVTVCYGSWKVTPEQVAAVAEAECAKFGYVAVYDRQDYQLCPVTTPVAAYYGCVPPSSAGRSLPRNAGSVSSGGPVTPAWAVPSFGSPVEPKDVEAIQFLSMSDQIPYKLDYRITKGYRSHPRL